MIEILDEKIETNNKKVFYKLSFFCSIITSGLFIYLFMGIPETIKMSDGLKKPSNVIIIWTQISFLIGMILAILSFTKREPSNWFKWVGATLSILSFLIIISPLIFTFVF